MVKKKKGQTIISTHLVIIHLKLMTEMNTYRR